MAPPQERSWWRTCLQATWSMSPADSTSLDGTQLAARNCGPATEPRPERCGSRTSMRGGTSASPGNLTNVNGLLYFAADDGVNGRELWQSDGTAAGTVMVRDISPGTTGSDPAYL